MSDNELLAIALGIGRALARTDWWELSFEDAQAFCADRARQKGVEGQELVRVVGDAIKYVLKPARYELQGEYANK